MMITQIDQQTINTYLYPLLFVINNKLTFKTEHCFATKTYVALPFCNRAGNLSAIDNKDIIQIKQYFGELPFRWFVDATEHESIQLLEQNGFEYTIAFPAMQIKLASVQPIDYGTIKIKEIQSKTAIDTWIEVVMKSYGIENDQFGAFIRYQVDHATPNTLRFYLAFSEGIAAAASMTIRFNNISALHWVGTLPEYRNKGLGYAVSHKPLLDAKADGCTDGVLFASELGKSVYKRIGFKEYALYNCYGL